MSEYFLFITPSAVRRTNPDEELKIEDGMYLARIAKSRASYALRGVEYSLTIPAEIIGQDDHIADSIRVHASRQIERSQEVSPAPIFLSDESTTVAYEEIIPQRETTPVAIAAPSAAMASSSSSNDYNQLTQDFRREMSRQELNTRNAFSSFRTETNNRLDAHERAIAALQAEVRKLNETVSSLSRIVTRVVDALGNGQ